MNLADKKQKQEDPCINCTLNGGSAVMIPLARHGSEVLQNVRTDCPSIQKVHASHNIYFYVCYKSKSLPIVAY